MTERPYRLTFRRHATATADLPTDSRRRVFDWRDPDLQQDAWAQLRDSLEGQRLAEGDLDWPAAPKRAQPTCATAPRRTTGRPNRGDPLLKISPIDYVPALTGQPVPPTGGTIHCPLAGHEDHEPSFQVWTDPERGWFCFGACYRGGSIYDLGRELSGLGDRGAEFRHLQQWITERLLRAPLGVES